MPGVRIAGEKLEQMESTPALNELARRLYETCHERGAFQLRSGLTTTEYFDKYRFEAQPSLLAPVARAMAGLIPPGTDVLAGLEMGGIPVATAIALECGMPVVFVRKKAKDYGTRRLAEGLGSLQGLDACVIEDVITTGGQVIASTNDLRSAGAAVRNVLCVIVRQPDAVEALRAAGLQLRSLFTQEQLELAARQR
jgi:orotate phosphoribosyltransferase